MKIGRRVGKGGGGDKGRVVYYVLERPFESNPPELRLLLKRLEESPLHGALRVRRIDLAREGRLFMELYNRVSITSMEPYSPLSPEQLNELRGDAVLVAFIGAKPIGFAVLRVEENGGKVGVVAYIGVLPQYRRKGVAALLGTKAVEYFREMGVDRVVAEVFIGNKAGLSLARKLGFRIVGQRSYG